MHHKKKLVIISLLFVIVVTSALVFFVCREVYSFVGEGIRAEQAREQDKLLQEASLLREELVALEEVLKKQETRSLYVNEKEDVSKHLHTIEEKALNIERMNLFYPQDLSIHLLSEFKNQHTDAIFDHARNIHILAQRFVRTQERILFENYATSQQRAKAQSHYDAVLEKIMKLCEGDRCYLPTHSMKAQER